MHECIDRFILPGRSFLDVQNESLLGYHVILTGYGKTGLLFTSVQYNETFNEVGEKYIHEKPNQQKKSQIPISNHAISSAKRNGGCKPGCIA